MSSKSRSLLHQGTKPQDRMPSSIRGSEARAAHAKRVLEEQKKVRSEEEARKKSTGKEREGDQTSELPKGNSSSCAPHLQEAIKVVRQGSAVGHQACAAAEDQALRNATADVNMSVIDAADLEISGSSPPPYSSPEDTLIQAVKKAVTKHLPETPERKGHEDVNQPLSPLASPTGSIHAAVVKTAMSPHDSSDNSVLVAGRSPSARVQTSSPAEEQEPDHISRPSFATHDWPSESESLLPKHMGIGATPSLTMPKSAAMINQSAVAAADLEAYRTIKAVIDGVNRHPSSQSFRAKTSLCREHWSLIEAKVASHAYGSGRVFPSFRSDLENLWKQAKIAFGAQSVQGQAAAVLERFASVIFAEMRNRSDETVRLNQSPKSVPIVGPESDARKEERRKAAAALLASWDAKKNLMPGKRGEKRPRSAAADSNASVSITKMDTGSKKIKQSPRRGIIGRCLSWKAPEGDKRRKIARPDVNMTAFHRAMTGRNKSPLVFCPSSLEAKQGSGVGDSDVAEETIFPISELTMTGEEVLQIGLTDKMTQSPELQRLSVLAPAMTSENSGESLPTQVHPDTNFQMAEAIGAPSLDQLAHPASDEQTIVVDDPVNTSSKKTCRDELLEIFRRQDTAPCGAVSIVSEVPEAIAPCPNASSDVLRESNAVVHQGTQWIECGRDDELQETQDVEKGLLCESGAAKQSTRFTPPSTTQTKPQNKVFVASSATGEFTGENNTQTMPPKRGKRGQRGRGACREVTSRLSALLTDSVASEESPQESPQSPIEGGERSTPLVAGCASKQKSTAKSHSKAPTRTSLRRRVMEKPELGSSTTAGSMTATEPRGETVQLPSLQDEVPSPLDAPATETANSGQADATKEEEPSPAPICGRRGVARRRAADKAADAPPVVPSDLPSTGMVTREGSNANSGRLSSMAASMLALLS